MKRFLKRVLLILILVGLDVLTKLLANGLEGDIILIKGVLRLTLIKNTGAAFSLLDNAPGAALALELAALLMLAVLIIKGGFNKGLSLSLCAMLAGGIGNLIDRLVSGAVTDFIYVEAISFPVFNFADICVTLGAICAVAFAIWGSEKNDA